jgi:hypothetical protein
MIVNFRIHEISQDAFKMIRTSMLIKKNYIYENKEKKEEEEDRQQL